MTLEELGQQMSQLPQQRSLSEIVGQAQERGVWLLGQAAIGSFPLLVATAEQPEEREPARRAAFALSRRLALILDDIGAAQLAESAWPTLRGLSFITLSGEIEGFLTSHHAALEVIPADKREQLWAYADADRESWAWAHQKGLKSADNFPISSVTELVDAAEVALDEDTVQAQPAIVRDWEYASPFRWSKAFNVLLVGGLAIAISLGGPAGLGAAGALIITQALLAASPLGGPEPP